MTDRRPKRPIFGKHTTWIFKATMDLRHATEETFEAAKLGLTVPELREKKRVEALGKEATEVARAISKTYAEEEQSQPREPWERRVNQDWWSSIESELEIRFDELAQSAGQRENPTWPPPIVERKSKHRPSRKERGG